MELYHHGTRGMKWGVRRYENYDGTLTEAGKKRYARDIRENLAKKKENRIDTSNPDPKRWVREDLTRAENVTQKMSGIVNKASELERSTAPKATKQRMDLSHMTDAELRQAITREQLEQQYNNLFAKTEAPAISKGREYTREALGIGGALLSVAGSALGIALAIKELSGE